jgi:hypothetical protein
MPFYHTPCLWRFMPLPSKYGAIADTTKPILAYCVAMRKTGAMFLQERSKNGLFFAIEWRQVDR